MAILILRNPTGTVPVGSLIQDTGYATPEQIALYLPITGTVSYSATASCRFKRTIDSTWTTGHPLYRIRPSFSETPTVGSVPDAFAWTIIDLTPGTSYDIEVTVIDGGSSSTKTLTTSTRSLPAASGATTKTANSVASIATQFASLNAGDVLEIADGTYNFSNILTLNRSGADGNPIYIRGQSRAGTILQKSDAVIKLLAANYVVFERMTLQGSGTDSNINASSWGVWIDENSGTSYNQTQVTFRNMTFTGVDKGIALFTSSGNVASTRQLLVYDCTLTGNNTWAMDLYTPPSTSAPDGTLDIDQNGTWNDDCICLSGQGNCAFNNTITGFGDTFAISSHDVATANVHVYRNKILMGGDDFVEADDSQRNISIYDNKARNTMTFLSLDPLYGGPLLFARNISINQGRSPFKFNTTSSGWFLYNNTVIRTLSYYTLTGSPTAEAGWYQSGAGGSIVQDSCGFRNNILIDQASGLTQTLRLDNSSGYTTMDFDHNAWYPDGSFGWYSGTYANLAAAQSGIPSTTPIFSGYTKRHTSDVITTSSPWVTTVTMASNYRTEVTTDYTPILADGTTPRNAGTPIPNITDEYSGAAPDIGAVIAGRSAVTYGDRS